MITAPGYVEVPPPLGTDSTSFLRVTEDVQSDNSLEEHLSTYARYESFLRNEAQLHFVVVTDDSSHMPAASFHAAMIDFLRLLAHSALYLGETFEDGCAAGGCAGLLGDRNPAWGLAGRGLAWAAGIDGHSGRLHRGGAATGPRAPSHRSGAERAERAACRHGGGEPR